MGGHEIFSPGVHEWVLSRQVPRCDESAAALGWLGAWDGHVGDAAGREDARGRAAAVMAVGGPGAARSAPEAVPEAPLQYSELLQHLVGDKRQPRLLDPGRLGGIPSPAKTEEQKMVERAMESCAFKAALACVGGEARRRGRGGGGGPGRPRGPAARRPRTCEAGRRGAPPRTRAEPLTPRSACAPGIGQSVGGGGCGGACRGEHGEGCSEQRVSEPLSQAVGRGTPFGSQAKL